MSIEKEPRHYRILVVDDLEHQRIAIKEAISDVVPSCDFVEAVNVTDATAVLDKESSPLDMVVVDLSLEEKEDGLLLVKAIRQAARKHAQARIIVVTAYPDVKTVCDAYESGAVSYLSKLDKDYGKKFREKVKELLEQIDIRDALWHQRKAQESAEKAFAKNRKAWIKKYNGMFIVIHDGRVIEKAKGPDEVQEALKKYTNEQRCDMAIIRVPSKGEGNAKR